jgi:hypothetical protein
VRSESGSRAGEEEGRRSFVQGGGGGVRLPSGVCLCHFLLFVGHVVRVRTAEMTGRRGEESRRFRMWYCVPDGPC